MKKGTRLNPLDHVSFPKNFFFDARDKAQLDYARVLIKTYDDRVKPILTGGNILEASKALDARMYFDQGGYLTGKFGIRQIPAMVSQKGKRLRIDEMPIPEKNTKD